MIREIFHVEIFLNFKKIQMKISSKCFVFLKVYIFNNNNNKQQQKTHLSMLVLLIALIHSFFFSLNFLFIYSFKNRPVRKNSRSKFRIIQSAKVNWFNMIDVNPRFLYLWKS